MKNTMTSVIVSLLLSAGLLSGIEPLQQFSFYVNLVINILVWIFLLTESMEEEVAVGVRRHVWIKLISSAVTLYALVFSGHPILATSSFMVQFFMLTLSFQKKAAV